MKNILISIIGIFFAACEASEVEEYPNETANKETALMAGLCSSAIDVMTTQTELAQEQEKTAVGLEGFESVKEHCNQLDDEVYQKIATQYLFDLFSISKGSVFEGAFIAYVVRSNENSTPIVKGIFGDSSFEIRLYPGLGWQVEFEH